MNAIEIAKRVVSIAVGLGTAQIVSAFIKNNVDTDNPYQKITVGSAGFAIGWAAADATSAYTDSKIDEAIAWYREARSTITP